MALPSGPAGMEGRGADARVELLAALARAAGFEEYGGQAVPAWCEAVDRAFVRARESAAVRTLRAQRSLTGLGFDALPSLTLHLDGEPESLRLRDTDPWSAGLEARWRGIDLPRFVEALNQAARRARFGQLCTALAPERERLASLARAAAEGVDLAWLEAWFGFPAPGPAAVVLSPLGGQHSYAVRRTGREPALLAVLGVSVDPESGLLTAAGLDTLVHELGHGFVNPVLAENERFVRGPGERLLAAVRGRMESLHYGDWPTVVNESVIRAFVVRYLHAHSGPSAARQETARQVTAGFPWTLVLADALGTYEAERDRYPTFGDFVPTLAATLDVIADEETARAGGRPRVVRVIPDPAHPVPADSEALVVTFSRRMHPTSWAIVGTPEDTPPSGAPSFDPSGTVFTLPWRLEAGRTYRFALNSLRFTGFRSEEGVPLEPVPLEVRVAR